MKTSHDFTIFVFICCSSIHNWQIKEKMSEQTICMHWIVLSLNGNCSYVSISITRIWHKTIHITIQYIQHTQRTIFSQQVTCQIRYCLSTYKEAVTHIKTLLQFSIIVMHIYYVYSGWQTSMHDSIHLCFVQRESGLRWIHANKKLPQMCTNVRYMLYVCWIETVDIN